MIPKDHDARLISLPEGVQVMRDTKIRYHWYNQISLASMRRLWGLMDRSLQPIGEPNTCIWKDQRGNTPSMERSHVIDTQPPRSRRTPPPVF